VTAADSVVAATAEVWVDSRRQGSAVLVDHRYLLSARHVISFGRRDNDVNPAKVRVRFPATRALEMDASAVTLEDAGQTDLAILDLGENLPTGLPRPVHLWAGRRLPGTVAVFGFPTAERNPEGVWRSFTVSRTTTSGLVQLQWEEGVGTFVGHSGGPVIDTDTDDLVGILLAGSEKGYFDRFVPLALVERVWPGLARPWLFAGEDARGHITRRARGQRSRAQGGDLFRGRAAALSKISEWLEQAPSGRSLVVTGHPGSGKSAVLGRGALSAEATYPGAGLAFQARGATVADLIDAVAAAIGVPTPQGIDGLLRSLESDGSGRLFVMVDALDEASTFGEAHEMAALITDLSRFPWVRTVVATRALAAGNRFEQGSLLNRLFVFGPSAGNLIDLDVTPYYDSVALTAFTAAVLSQDGADYPGPVGCAWAEYRANTIVRDRLADLIAHRADRNFLVAAITATTLSTQDSVVDPSAPDFDSNALPASIGEALEKYLDSLSDDYRPRIKGLLTAIAYARGAGITDRRWIRFAAALGYHADQALLDSLRESAAADYLLQLTDEIGERIVRLFHQALVDQLTIGRPKADHKAVLNALLEDVQAAGGWDKADDYARAYTAEHATSAGELARILGDPQFVAYADVPRLITVLGSAELDRLPAIALLIIQEGPRLARLPCGARLALLAIAATHLGLLVIRDNLLARGAQVSHPLWAHPLGGQHKKLTGHTGAVNAVAVGRLGDQDIVVSGSADKTVRIWDHNGNPIGNPLTGHTGAVNAVAVGRLGDQDIVVSGGKSGFLIWEPTGTILKARPARNRTVAIGALGHREVIASAAFHSIRLFDSAGDLLGGFLTDSGFPKTALAIGRLGDRDVVVSGGSDKTVRIWDRNGTLIGEPLLGHRGTVKSVAVGRLRDRSVVASAGMDSTVRIWDDKGASLGSLSGHTGTVRTVTIGHLGDRDVIIYGGDDTVVRVWDNYGSHDKRNGLHNMHSVLAVATGRLNGHDVIVSGGTDNTVRVWDGDGTPIATLTGHSRWVNAVAIGSWGGQDVIASGGVDKTVRVWDGDGTPIATLTGHSRSVNAVAIGSWGGQNVIASGGRDKTVRVWDGNGARIAVLRGQGASVNAVAIGSWGGQDVIASGGADGTVRVWDGNGTPIATLTGHSLSVNAVSTGHLGSLDVIVSGSGDSAIRIWVQESRVSYIIPTSEAVSALALTEDRILAGGVALAMFELTDILPDSQRDLEAGICTSFLPEPLRESIPRANVPRDAREPSERGAEVVRTGGRNSLGEELIRQTISAARKLLNSGDPEAAFRYLIPSLAGEPAGVCVAADAAFASRHPAHLDSVTASLQESRIQELPAVQGRLFAIAVDREDIELAKDVAERIDSAGLAGATIGLIRMLSQDPHREWGVYESSTAATKAGLLPLGNALLSYLPVLIATRVLAVARGMSGSDPVVFRSIRDGLLQSYWAWFGEPESAQLTGLIDLYGRDHTALNPPLLPYQVVSIYETMECIGIDSPVLSSNLRRSLLRQLEGYSGRLRKDFLAWASYSDFASNVCETMTGE
jgi:WD40 repeat protein